MARARNNRTPAGPAPAPAERRAWRAPALIFLAVWVVYWNSLAGEFVFDDTSIIQSNPQIQRLDGDHLRHIFGSHYWQTVAGQGGLYRPLTVLSYAANYAAGGLDPWGYHFVNVLVHALNAVLVWLVIRELFGEGTFAFWSGLLFALHPIRTEAVAYVVGRAESLAALWFLAAWWLYLRERRWLAAGAFALAMLSKESAFAFLAVLPLSDWVRRRGFGRETVWRYAPVAAAAVAVMGLRYAVLGGFAPLYVNPTSNPLAAAGTAERLMTATAVLARYLWLLVFPVPLSADYSFNQIQVVKGPGDGWFIAGALALVALAAGMTRAWRKAPAWFFYGAFFIATFGLTSNFLRPIGTIMAERLLYLPSLGFTCAVAYAVARARQREMALGLAALLAVFYAGRTITRNTDWHDHLALFSSAAVVSPNSSLVQANLANALLYIRRDPAGAAEHAHEAIRIEPGDPAAHMTLGEAYERMGDWPRAAEAYARVEQLAPGTPGAQQARTRRERRLHATPAPTP